MVITRPTKSLCKYIYYYIYCTVQVYSTHSNIRCTVQSYLGKTDFVLYRTDNPDTNSKTTWRLPSVRVGFSADLGFLNHNQLISIFRCQGVCRWELHALWNNMRNMPFSFWNHLLRSHESEEMSSMRQAAGTMTDTLPCVVCSLWHWVISACFFSRDDISNPLHLHMHTLVSSTNAICRYDPSAATNTCVYSTRVIISCIGNFIMCAVCVHAAYLHALGQGSWGSFDYMILLSDTFSI